MYHCYSTGTLVTIYGRISVLNNRRNVNAYHIAAITDFNEVSLHLAQIIYAHVINTADEQTLNELNLQNVQEYEKYRKLYKKQRQESNSEQKQDTNQCQSKIINSILENRILGIIRQEQESNKIGCTKNVLYNELTTYNVTIINDSLQELQKRGSIYATVDDDTFKSSMQ